MALVRGFVFRENDISRQEKSILNEEAMARVMIAALEQSRPADLAISDRIVASLEGVHKSYGTVRALRGVDFHVRAGEVVALLGPNGCLLYTSPSPRDRQKSRMPSSA